MHGSAVPMTFTTSGSPSVNTNNASSTNNNFCVMLPRTSSNDDTRRSDDRPTLPPIRDLFGRELSQPLHPNGLVTPINYSPSSHFNQLSLPDESQYRVDQGRSIYNPSPGIHAQAGNHTHLRPLTTPYPSSQRAQRTGYASPMPAAQSLVPFQPESHGTTRSAPSTSNHAGSGYKPESYNYNPKPPPAAGTAQYSYPPPPPPPPQQSYGNSSTSRAASAGYQYARQMVPSYPTTSSAISSGLVTPEQPSAKYECPYCGKGFTRPSSLKIHVHSHTGERPFRCTFEGCSRTFSVQSNMRRHARTHLQSGNEARESEGEEESEEDSPQPQVIQAEEAPPSR
ncbi:hypothetical protein B0F90DRAFT_1700817 [Multifurca ochricompacta]|uniref:C2H2-type domain-containing protein n=1 Tax=Multifurca ochricompacta TaxID=376703 RepID=A0AAD4QPL3_9AGAM|nr:hypothetical protein B0F90DRAFT_1700817 [Multifurca ochricompacta]